MSEQQWVIAWNNLVNKDCLNSPDLSYTDFSQAYLKRINFWNANLSYTNFSGADLERGYLMEANFKEANLTRANLSRANLRYANLSGANLRGANLSGANLSGANLAGVQAQSVNFEGATLTGACLKKWRISSRANLKNLICDYVYLDYQFGISELTYKERCPSELNRNFAPGEFIKLFQNVIRVKMDR